MIEERNKGMLLGFVRFNYKRLIKFDWDRYLRFSIVYFAQSLKTKTT